MHRCGTNPSQPGSSLQRCTGAEPIHRNRAARWVEDRPALRLVRPNGAPARNQSIAAVQHEGPGGGATIHQGAATEGATSGPITRSNDNRGRPTAAAQHPPQIPTTVSERGSFSERVRGLAGTRNPCHGRRDVSRGRRTTRATPEPVTRARQATCGVNAITSRKPPRRNPSRTRDTSTAGDWRCARITPRQPLRIRQRTST